GPWRAGWAAAADACAAASAPPAGFAASSAPAPTVASASRAGRLGRFDMAHLLRTRRAAQSPAHRGAIQAIPVCRARLARTASLFFVIGIISVVGALANSFFLPATVGRPPDPGA